MKGFQILTIQVNGGEIFKKGDRIINLRQPQSTDGIPSTCLITGFNYDYGENQLIVQTTEGDVPVNAIEHYNPTSITE